MDVLQQYQTEIKRLCDLYNVKSLFAFGSVLTDRFNDNSDIDLIVDIDETDPLIYSDKYFNLKSSLENMFSRHIDLLEERGIKNPFLKENIDNQKKLIYGY